MSTRVLTFMMAILLAGAATALATDDLVGLYFDPDAQSQCLDASELNPGSAIDLYLILQNPTQPAIYGFEAGVQFEPDSILFLNQTFPVPAFGVGLPFDQMVGYAEPLPTGTATVLVSYQFALMGLGPDGLCIRLTGSSLSSLDPLNPNLYYGDDQTVVGNVAPGPFGPDCTAVIGDCAVGVEALSFDAMKALYR